MKIRLTFFCLIVVISLIACAPTHKGFVVSKRTQGDKFLITMNIPHSDNVISTPQYHQYYRKFCLVSKDKYEALREGDVFTCERGKIFDSVDAPLN